MFFLYILSLKITSGGNAFGHVYATFPPGPGLGGEGVNL